MIETVLGAINKEQLGITMCHEHLAMDLSPVRGENDSVFNNREVILPELFKLKNQGCKSIVEVTSEDMGRNIDDLKYYAKELDMNIIASTGAYLLPYHTEFILNSSIDELCSFFVDELTIGMSKTGVKAGLIAEIATSNNCVNNSEKKVFISAGLASKETGCAVSTHCDGGTCGFEQVELLLQNKMPAQKIILGHMDLLDNVKIHKELLSLGVNIGFDTIGKTAYLSDERRTENLLELISCGYENQLVLSQDVSRISYMTKFGGKGYTAVLSDFKEKLLQMGLSEIVLNKILINNPSRILDRTM